MIVKPILTRQDKELCLRSAKHLRALGIDLAGQAALANDPDSKRKLTRKSTRLLDEANSMTDLARRITLLYEAPPVIQPAPGTIHRMET